MHVLKYKCKGPDSVPNNAKGPQQPFSTSSPTFQHPKHRPSQISHNILTSTAYNFNPSNAKWPNQRPTLTPPTFQHLKASISPVSTTHKNYVQQPKVPESKDATSSTKTMNLTPFFTLQENNNGRNRSSCLFVRSCRTIMERPVQPLNVRVQRSRRSQSEY